MTKTMIAGISAKLREGFGEACAVYTEQPGQGTQGPCFFIALMKSSETTWGRGRRLRSNTFELQYIPETKTAFHEEADNVAEVLYEKLASLELADGPIGAASMSCEKKEGVLCFYAQYELIFMEQKNEAEAMGELSARTKVRD